MANKLSRRDFVAGSAAAGMLIAGNSGLTATQSRKRVALVGAGIRGTSFWGKYLLDNYGDVVEYVGVCDINPGRLEYALKHLGVDCPV